MPLQDSQILTLAHTGLFCQSTLARAGFLLFNPCPCRFTLMQGPFLNVAHQDYCDASPLPILWINSSPYMIAVLYNPYPCRFPMICPPFIHGCVCCSHPQTLVHSEFISFNPCQSSVVAMNHPWPCSIPMICPCKAVALLNPCPYKVPMINPFPHRVVMWHPCQSRVAMISSLSIQVIMFNLCPYSRTRM